MKKTAEFANILDECVQRLLKGESLASCLARYPQHAAELEPLLRTAQETLNGVAIKPRDEFRARARYEFQTALREMETKRRHRFFAFVPRWAVAVSLVIVILMVGTGTVAASSASLPDSPLYPVKLATEAVRLALTPSALGKAELNARFADERVKEIVQLTARGDAGLVETTAARLGQQLSAVADLAAASSPAEEEQPALMMAPVPTPAPKVTISPPSPTAPPESEGIRGQMRRGESKAPAKPDRQQKLKEALAAQAQENLQALEAELAEAPEPLKPALRHAIEIAQRAYAEALSRLGK